MFLGLVFRWQNVDRKSVRRRRTTLRRRRRHENVPLARKKGTEDVSRLTPDKNSHMLAPRTRGWRTRQLGCWPDARSRLRVSRVP